MDLLNSYNFLELQTHDEKFLKNRYKIFIETTFITVFKNFLAPSKKERTYLNLKLKI